MPTRNRAIISGRYTRALVKASFDSDFVSLPRGLRDEVPDWLENAIDHERFRYRRSPGKREALQLLLLNDTLHVASNAAEAVLLNQLESEGFVSILDEPQVFGVAQSISNDVSMQSYAAFLKPIVMPELIRTEASDLWSSIPAPKKATLAGVGISRQKFFSRLFDLACGSHITAADELDPVLLEAARSYGSTLYARAPAVMDELFGPDVVASDAFSSLWESSFLTRTAKLMLMLEFSVTHDATLIQSEFGDSLITATVPDQLEGQATRAFASWRLIRVAYESIVGSLPATDSLSDVLRLKYSRRREIARLREVLGVLEESLRHGQSDANALAIRDVQLAVADLNRGLNLDRISKWATYLAIPSAVAELHFGVIPATSMTVSLVGLACTLGSQITKTRSGWLSVVR